MSRYDVNSTYTGERNTANEMRLPENYTRIEEKYDINKSIIKSIELGLGSQNLTKDIPTK